MGLCFNDNRNSIKKMSQNNMNKKRNFMQKLKIQN